VTTFAVTGRAATWSGTGSWNGHAGYTFMATAIDQTRNSRDWHSSRVLRRSDQLRITVKSANGTVVFTIDGPVTRGNIVVSARSGGSHDHDGHDWFRLSRLPIRS
jgi:hypothetical protein